MMSTAGPYVNTVAQLTRVKPCGNRVSKRVLCEIGWQIYSRILHVFLWHMLFISYKYSVKRCRPGKGRRAVGRSTVQCTSLNRILAAVRWFDRDSSQYFICSLFILHLYECKISDYRKNTHLRITDS